MHVFTSPPDIVLCLVAIQYALFFSDTGNPITTLHRFDTPTVVKQWEWPSPVVAHPSDTVWTRSGRRLYDIASKHHTCCIVVRYCLIVRLDLEWCFSSSSLVATRCSSSPSQVSQWFFDFLLIYHQNLKWSYLQNVKPYSSLLNQRFLFFCNNANSGRGTSNSYDKS